jgi:ubiquitin-conjugating enzyme E2 A
METAWEGGVFQLRITFGEHYPDKPPRVRFTSEVFHPNVSGRGKGSGQVLPVINCHWFSTAQHSSFGGRPPCLRACCLILAPCFTLHPVLQVYNDGTLCLDIIQEHWSPCHNICSILTSIQSLLTDPNCASPANPEAAQVPLLACHPACRDLLLHIRHACCWCGAGATCFAAAKP